MLRTFSGLFLLAAMSFSSITNADQAQNSYSSMSMSNISSSEARLNKKIVVAMGMIRQHYTASSFVNLAYQAKNDVQIFAQYNRLIDEGTTFNDKDYFTDEQNEFLKNSDRGKSIDFGIRKFSGNSFFFQLSAYSRQQNLASAWTFSQGELRDHGISFGIGNIWSFKNFNIGAEWIGISQSLSNNAGDLADELDSSYRLNNVRLLGLQMGFSI